MSVELCGPHIAISTAMAQSSNGTGDVPISNASEFDMGWINLPIKAGT